MNLTKYISSVIHTNGITTKEPQQIYDLVSNCITLATNYGLGVVKTSDTIQVINKLDKEVIIEIPSTNEDLVIYFTGLCNTYSVHRFCDWYKINKIPTHIREHFGTE